jgi:hypothetical protein
MPPKTFLFGITVIAVVIIIAGVSWTLVSNKPSPTPSPSPTQQITPYPVLTPAPSTPAFPTSTGNPDTLNGTTSVPSTTQMPSPQDQIRDAAMIYIKYNHPETAPIITNASWSTGKLETGLVGSETIIYYDGGWTVTVQYPVVPNPVYTVTANYTVGDVYVVWQATYDAGAFKDESYASVNLHTSSTATPTPSPSSSPLSTQEQARDAIMGYLRTNHNETAVYMQNLAWTGGRATPAGIVGAETYTYLSNGWNITMQYPVYPNPLYTVTAKYVSPVSQVFPEKTHS